MGGLAIAGRKSVITEASSSNEGMMQGSKCPLSTLSGQSARQGRRQPPPQMTSPNVLRRLTRSGQLSSHTVSRCDIPRNALS